MQQPGIHRSRRHHQQPEPEYYEAEHACTFLVANNSKGVFTDKRLREAVARAIDREDPILGV